MRAIFFFLRGLCQIILCKKNDRQEKSCFHVVWPNNFRYCQRHRGQVPWTHEEVSVVAFYPSSERGAGGLDKRTSCPGSTLVKRDVGRIGCGAGSSRAFFATLDVLFLGTMATVWESEGWRAWKRNECEQPAEHEAYIYTPGSLGDGPAFPVELNPHHCHYAHDRGEWAAVSGPRGGRGGAGGGLTARCLY